MTSMEFIYIKYFSLHTLDAIGMHFYFYILEDSVAVPID